MAYTATIKIPGIGECYGITSAPNGEIYVSRGNSIYKVDLQRRVSLFAGSGGEKSGWRDDENLKALFSRPSGLCLASNSDLYICDFDNHRIRVIRDGRVSTLAGTGKKGFLDSTTAKMAQFNHPVQLVERFGYIFVTDLGNKCVRVIDLANDTVTSLLYDPDASKTPSGYMSTQQRKEIRKKPSKYGLGTPSGIAISKSGHLYITDRWTHSIHRVVLSLAPTAIEAKAEPIAPSQSPTENASSAPSSSDASAGSSEAKHEQKQENIETTQGVITSPSAAPAPAPEAPKVVKPAQPAASVMVDDTDIWPTLDVARGLKKSSNDDSTAVVLLGADLTEVALAAPSAPVAEAAPAFLAAPIPATVTWGDVEEAVPAVPAEVVPVIPCPWNVDSFSKIAGQKQPGHTDSIQLTSAQFRCPTSIAIDPTNTLLIADRNNHTIRYMNDVDGVMTEIGVNLTSPQATLDGHPSDAGTSLPTDLTLLSNGDLAWVEASGSLRINTRDCEDTFAAHVLADHRIPGFYNLSITNDYWNSTYGFNEEVLASHPWLSTEVFKSVLKEAKTRRETDLKHFVHLVNGAFFSFADYATPNLLEIALQSIALFKEVAKRTDETATVADADAPTATAYVAPLLHWLESIVKRTSHSLSTIELFTFLASFRTELLAHPPCLALVASTIRSRTSWRTSKAQVPIKRLEDSLIPRSTPEEMNDFKIISAYISGQSIPELPVPVDYKPPVHWGWTPLTRPLRGLIAQKQEEPDWTFTIAGREEEFKAHSWFLYTRWNFFYRLMESGFSELDGKRTELPADFPPSVLKNVLALVHFRVLNIVEPLDHNDALFVLERGEEFDWKTAEPSESVLFYPLYSHAYAALELALKKLEKPEEEHSYVDALTPIDVGFEAWEAAFDLKKYAALFPGIELPVLLFQGLLAPEKEEEPETETPEEESAANADVTVAAPPAEA